MTEQANPNTPGLLEFSTSNSARMFASLWRDSLGITEFAQENALIQDIQAALSAAALVEFERQRRKRGITSGDEL